MFQINETPEIIIITIFLKLDAHSYLYFRFSLCFFKKKIHQFTPDLSHCLALLGTGNICK